MAMLDETSGGTGHGARSHREYRRAQRHTRLVRFLKIALPVVSALMIVGFIGISMISSQVPDDVEIASAGIEDGKLVMESPVMSGHSANGDPYLMRAERAVQDLTTPSMIALEGISADLPAGGRGKAILSATRGLYDRNQEILTFTEPFSVEMADGMTAGIGAARIDLASGTLVSDAPVSIRASGSDIVAQSFEMQDKGNTIIFRNQVRMTIQPSMLKSGEEKVE